MRGFSLTSDRKIFGLGIVIITLETLSLRSAISKRKFEKYPVTHLNVHQMLKHIVFSQKKAARKKKCAMIAETETGQASL